MSPKLPVVTPKKVIRALKRAGFVFKRQTGSHQTYIHPERPHKVVTVPYHATDLKKSTLKNILRQAEMRVDELIDLL